MEKSKKHMTPSQMKKKEEISSAMKRKDTKEYMSNKYGKRADEVRSRTAIKMAMKESYKDFFKQQLIESLLSEVSLVSPPPFVPGPMPETNPETPRIPLPDPYAPRPFNPYKPQRPVRPIRPVMRSVPPNPVPNPVPNPAPNPVNPNAPRPPRPPGNDPIPGSDPIKPQRPPGSQPINPNKPPKPPKSYLSGPDY